MENEFQNLTATKAWHVLVEAAKRAASEAGYELERQPGRGRSNIWKIKQNGQEQLACIRTTRDRWIAFPPLKDRWKTLDDVDVVIVSAVDDAGDPTKVEVYIFPANEVRDRFNASHKARIDNGQSVRDNFGMWVALDHDDRGIASSVGSGIVETYSPIAVFPLVDLDIADDEGGPDEAETAGPHTIADVLVTATQQIARIAGVMPDRVKLNLTIEH